MNYRQKKAENFLSDETLKIKRCRPMFCYLSLLFFFGGWFYSLTVTNHGETLTFFFTCYLKVLVDSLRHGFFFYVWWMRWPNAFAFWSKCAGTRTSKTFAQCSWERYFTLTVHFVNKGARNCYDNLARC